MQVAGKLSPGIACLGQHSHPEALKWTLTIEVKFESMHKMLKVNFKHNLILHNL